MAEDVEAHLEAGDLAGTVDGVWHGRRVVQEILIDDEEADQDQYGALQRPRKSAQSCRFSPTCAGSRWRRANALG